MHIGDLTVVIVEKILRMAIESLGEETYRWKNKFPLLAVCSEWRQVALRIVYRDAFVEGNLQYNMKIGPEAQKVDFSTNIDLITALGVSRHVRNLSICLEESRFIQPFVKEMPLLFAFENNKWNKVESLSLNMYKGFIRNNGDSKQDDMEIETMADLIIEHMPRVSKIRLDSGGEPAILAAGIKSKLLGRYASQLTYLTSGGSVAHDFSHFSNELTHLELRINHSSLPLMPKVNPRALQKLVLTNIPSHFSWSHFATKSGEHANELDFSNLRILQMFYTGMPEGTELNHSALDANRLEQSRNPYAVRFPKLQELGITSYPPDAQLSFVAEYPKRMRKVTLRYSFLPPSVFATSKISEISILDMTVYYAQLEESSEFYALTNHLLGSSINIKNRSSLMLSYDDFDLDMSQCKWNNITVLRVMSQVSYETLETLVRQMPHLERLSIYELAFGEQSWQRVAEDVSLDLEDHVMQQVTPWKTTVEHLDVLSLAYESCPDTVVLCFKRFLLHVTTLCTLQINGCRAMGLGDFVDEFAPHYPHLSRVLMSG